MKKNRSSKEIVIKDNSIAVCLLLTGLLVVAGLILAKVSLLGESGRLYADPIQSRVFRFKTDPPQSRVEGAPASAAVEPERPNPAAAPSGPDPVAASEKMVPPAPIPSEAKAPKMDLPKQADPLQTDSKPASNAPERRAAAAETQLRTMRGGRHLQYASIVFEFSAPVDYDAPRVEGEVIRLKIRSVATHLRPFRKYQTFDSWVRLDKADGDMNVAIGILPGFVRFSDFLMEDPHRLVVNLYDKGK